MDRRIGMRRGRSDQGPGQTAAWPPINSICLSATSRQVRGGGSRIPSREYPGSWLLSRVPKVAPLPIFYPCFHGTSNRLLDGLISPQFARIIFIAGPRGKRTRPEWSQAKRTMRLDVLRAAKHGHQSARLMCPTGWVGGMIAGQGDGDRNPAISAAICADRELHVRCTCNNVPRPSQEAPARKSQPPRSAPGDDDLACGPRCSRQLPHS